MMPRAMVEDGIVDKEGKPRLGSLSAGCLVSRPCLVGNGGREKAI